MKKTYYCVVLVVKSMTLMALSGCHFIDKVEQRAKVINQSERVALALAKENRELEIKINNLKYQIRQLHSKNTFLESQLKRSGNDSGRSLASIGHKIPRATPNYKFVEWDIYQWSPEELLSTARQAFDSKDFKKSAEYFHALLTHYPDHHLVTAQVYYQAGVASFESGNYLEWAIDHMRHVEKHFSSSPFYRGAKLWKSLSLLQMGQKDQFFETVELFRKQYRNTPEWRIIRAHYEDLRNEYRPR